MRSGTGQIRVFRMTKLDLQREFTMLSVVLPFPEASDVERDPLYRKGWERCSSNVYQRMEELLARHD